MPRCLSAEICDLIIDALAENSGGLSRTDGLLNGALRACALTCRSWLQRSRRHLYSTVCLYGDVQSSRFAQTVKTSDLGVLVKELHIVLEDYSSILWIEDVILVTHPDIFQILQNVDQLGIWYTGMLQISIHHDSRLFRFLSKMRSVRHLELHRLEFSWISDTIDSILAFSELSSIVTENVNWRSYIFDKFLDDYHQHEDRGKLIIATLCYDRYVCKMSHALSNTLVDLRLIPSAFPSSFRLGHPTVHPAHLPKLETLSIAIPSMDGYELIHDLLLHLDAPHLHSIELQHAFRDYPRYQCDSMLKLLDAWFGPIFANPARVFPSLKSLTIAFPDFAWKENDSWWGEKTADVFPQCSGRNMLHVRIDRTQYN